MLYVIIGLLAIIVILHLLQKQKNVTVYGSMGCGWTTKQLDYLNEKGISHVFVDCDKERCPPFVEGFPTMKLANGDIKIGFKRL